MVASPTAVFIVRNERALSSGSFTKLVVTPVSDGDVS